MQLDFEFETADMQTNTLELSQERFIIFLNMRES